MAGRGHQGTPHIRPRLIITPMEHIWEKIDGLRAKYDLLGEDHTPIDVFTFFEVDLGLDAIPFDDLLSKYRVEAAIKADFSGIYLDAEQYALMEKGPEWKLNPYASPWRMSLRIFSFIGNFPNRPISHRCRISQVISVRLDREGIWPAS